MVLTKEEVQVRRMAAVGGIVAGTLLTPLAHFILGPGSQKGNRAHYLPILGDISGWPWYLRSFWPLDVLETMVAFATLLYLLLSFHKIDRVQGRRGWSMFGLWVVVGMGSLGSVMMSASEGWLFGLFGFLAFPVAYAILLGAVCAAVLAIALVVSVGAGIGYLSRNTWVGQWSRYWFRRLIYYVEARDKPDDEPAQA